MPGGKGLSPDNPEVKVAAEFVRRWNSANRAQRAGQGNHDQCAEILAEAGRFAICLWEEEFHAAGSGKLPSAANREAARQRVFSTEYEPMRAEGLGYHKAARHELKRYLLDERLARIETTLNNTQSSIIDDTHPPRQHIIVTLKKLGQNWVRDGLKELFIAPWTVVGVFVFLIGISCAAPPFIEWLGHLSEEQQKAYAAARNIAAGHQFDDCVRAADKSNTPQLHESTGHPAGGSAAAAAKAAGGGK